VRSFKIFVISWSSFSRTPAKGIISWVNTLNILRVSARPSLDEVFDVRVSVEAAEKAAFRGIFP
jgi:hypothetical protein